MVLYRLASDRGLLHDHELVCQVVYLYLTYDT